MDSLFIPIRRFNSVASGYYVYVIQDREENEPQHHHDFYQICFVVRGSIRHIQGDSDFTLVKNDALIVPPGFSHRILFNPDCIVYSLYFTEEYVAKEIQSSEVKKLIAALQIDKNAQINPHIKLKISLHDHQIAQYISLMDCLLQEFHANDPCEFSITSQLITACLLIITKSYLQNPFGLKQYTTVDENLEIIQNCVEYIDRHYMKEISATTLTKRFPISKSMLYRLFPQITGKTIKEYITDRRIDSALSLVNISDLSYNQIAEMVGYNEFSTFYRNFVKVVGISPKEYRFQKNVPETPPVRPWSRS